MFDHTDNPMDPYTYKLDAEHRLVKCKNDDDWFRWLEANRRVLHSVTKDREVVVDTAFVGIDQSYGTNKEPQVFETMIFGGEYDEYAWTSSTWDEAVWVHNVVYAAIRALQDQATHGG